MTTPPDIPKATAPNPVPPSIVRTCVALIVGALITWAIGHGVDLHVAEVPLTELLTALFSALYYTVVRLAEHYVSPKAGWLLGLAKAPNYPPKAI